MIQRISILSLWQEFRTTFALAFPMIMGQIGQLMMNVVDTIMVARLGIEPLAAVGFGSILMLFCLIIAMGLCTAVHVLVSHANGPNKHEVASEILKHGIWVVLFYSVPLAITIQLGINFLDYFDQPPAVLVQAKPFVIYLAWSNVFALVFRCFRNYSEAWNRPWSPFWVTFVFILVNVFFNWILIFGNLGFPAMGSAGAGLARLLAMVLSLVVMMYIIFKNPEFQLKWKVKNFFNLHPAMLKRVLAIGVPTFIQISFEYGFIAMAVIMMGWLGTLQLASQQVLGTYSALIFMIPLSLAFATTIRVGHSYALKDFKALYLISVGNIFIGAVFMGICAICTYLFRDYIPYLFVTERSVILMVSELFIFVALFQVWDGIQVITMAVLRGMADLMVPLAIVLSAYWLFGIPAAYFLGFKNSWGASGIWSGQVLGIACAACFLLIRFKIVTKRFKGELSTKTSPVPVEQSQE